MTEHIRQFTTLAIMSGSAGVSLVFVRLEALIESPKIKPTLSLTLGAISIYGATLVKSSAVQLRLPTELIREN